MLQADIQWREQYVSHALNRKFAGIIPTGIYEGFACRANGYNVIVGEEGAQNTAVVESNGYSITVRLTEPENIAPSAEKPYVVIDARYQMGMVTIARLQVAAAPESHHLVLCKVVDTGSEWLVETAERDLAKTVRLDGAIAEMAAAQIDQMHRYLLLRDESQRNAKAAQHEAEEKARLIDTTLSARIAQADLRHKQAQQSAITAMAITGTAAINTMTRQISMMDRLLAVEKASGI